MANPDAATLSRLAELLIAGRLRVPIERTYQLSEVPAAIKSAIVRFHLTRPHHPGNEPASGRPTRTCAPNDAFGAHFADRETGPTTRHRRLGNPRGPRALYVVHWRLRRL
jgi:hypothetical protein